MQLSLPYMMIVFRNYSHSVSNQREMRSCLFLITLVLFFTGLSQVEGKSKYQFVNFLKFLKLMKANGWDKKYLDSNNRKIIKNLLLPKKIKQDYGSELESLESNKKEKTLRHFHEGKI